MFGPVIFSVFFFKELYKNKFKNLIHTDRINSNFHFRDWDRQYNCQKTKGQTMIYKTLHRKLKVEQHVHVYHLDVQWLVWHVKSLGVHSRNWCNVYTPFVTLTNDMEKKCINFFFLIALNLRNIHGSSHSLYVYLTHG